VHTATEILIADHRKVVRELDKLDNILTNVEEQSVRRDEIIEMANFINDDINNHFLKEEKYLFPILAGIPGMTEGPLKLIKYEHDKYWNISLKFLELLERQLSDKLNDEDIAKLKNIGRTLITLLRVHIDKEDNVLFPMVEQYLDDEILLETADNICFSEGPIEIESNVIIMDVSHTKKSERQQEIIDTFNNMPQGKEIKIINNNRLKYLHNKFENKCRGRYAWRVDEEGPDKWVALIKKVA